AARRHDPPARAQLRRLDLHDREREAREPVHAHDVARRLPRRDGRLNLITWGTLEGPPNPPTLGSAPAQPWRSSSVREIVLPRPSAQPSGLVVVPPSPLEPMSAGPLSCRGDPAMA